MADPDVLQPTNDNEVNLIRLFRLLKGDFLVLLKCL